MKRFATIVALVLAAGALAPTSLDAQPAAALGHPLPDGKLPEGTVSVRVVAGSPANPVVGSDVTLVVNDTPRVARTDSAGRATFNGLPVGAQVQAKVQDADKKDISSDTFPIPSDGGVRLMLSTKPFGGMGGSPEAPFAGGGAGGGMPEPRQMSGQPRPDRDDAPGVYTVRVTYNELKMNDGKLEDPNPPVGTPVAMVGYSADDSVTVQIAPLGSDGLVHFKDLDQSGGTSYFALSQLARTTGTDRLIAVPAVLDGQQGARVVLSGDKRDATAPPIDDYGKLVPADAFSTPAGKIRVTLDGIPTEPDAMITILDAVTGKPLGMTQAKRGQVDNTNVRGGANFDSKSDLPAGTLDIELRGGAGSTTEPLAGVEVSLVNAGDEKPLQGLMNIKTDAQGKARFTAKVSADVKAVVIVNGKPLASAPLDLTKAGGRLEVTAQWEATGRPEALFDVTVKPGTVVYAQTRMSGQLFRSLPFQTAAEAGTRASIYIYPRTLFHFSLRAFIEDQLLGVQGTWEITNYSWAPYRAGPDGFLLPLPDGHKGGIVAGPDQTEVAVAKDEGFRLMRPIPPGGRKFRAGFSLPVEDGDVSWSWPLPIGTWQSGVEIRQSPGLTVKLPSGTVGETKMASTGEPWFVVDNITIDRKQTMAMTITGLPAEPAWKRWVPRIAGVVVLMMILAGIGFALLRTPVPVVPDTEARREKLMTELVELERNGGSPRRKEQLIDELERLWGT